MSKNSKNILAYLLISVGAVTGVFALSERTKDNIANNINKAVTELCVQNIPVLQAENDLIDVQIEVTEETKKLNIQAGDTQRAAINDKYIRALKNAKRYIPTIDECNEELID